MEKLTAAAALAALVVTSGALPSTSTAFAAETCQGQVATVVPDADGYLIGTPGPDVIVTHGARVRAGDGDDLICLVSDDIITDVDAGPGDDTVDASRSLAYSMVSLGLGEDSFIGGPGEDQVHGSAFQDLDDVFAVPPPDTERDVIATGGGEDRVTSGELGAANPDVVSTGRGDDRVTLQGLDHALSLAVGEGRNTVAVTLAAAETTAWSVNQSTRTLGFDERTSRWQGRVNRWIFVMAKGQARSSLVFLGSRAGENVFVSGPRLVPHVRMGGGDDWAGSLTAKGGTFFLGDGRDRLTLGKYNDVSVTYPFAFLTVDLRQHRAAFGGGITSPVFGVEELRATAVQLEVVGSRLGRNHITAYGCSAQVDGGLRGDLLVRGQVVTSICDSVATRMRGGAGDDLLFGSSQTDDVLLGGPGFDRARGMRGDDLCRAEVTRGCERT